MIPGITEPQGIRWRKVAGISACALVIAALHAAILLPLVMADAEPPLPPTAPEAIMIELAPMPEAPKVAEEIAPTPPPPPPEEEPPAPPEPEVLPEPEPVEETPEPPPEVKPEVVIPKVEKKVEKKPEPRVEKKPEPKPEPKPKPRPKPPEPPKKVEPQPEQPPKAQAKEAKQAEVAKAAPVDPGVLAQRKQAERSWKSELMAHLARNYRYPRAARIRHQSGIVTVSVTVSRSGEVLSARVVKSAGSEILDDDAVQLLHRSSPLPAPPSHQSESFSIPIRYSLNR
ncbi:energy transducer TonB [Pokkaliibacter sp. CJK22405]|uniref:energy transducer TonB n=1 Tax=Pokkaliibacter sp. CJK22405 TaxID=3384615 RepID=UPI00398545E9